MNSPNDFDTLFGKDFDASRYHAGTCQHCDHPCAIRCGCGEVVAQDAVTCPTCGYYHFAANAEDDELNRVLMVVCSRHATE